MPARLTPDQMYLRSWTEAQWQRIVEGVAHVGGWLWFHAPDNMPRVSRRGTSYVQAIRAGFPDLVLVKGRRSLCVELKTETGRVAPEQLRWLDALATAGHDVALWRPRDQALMERVLLHGDDVPPWVPGTSGR
jgi:hypothetical protein